MSKQKKCKRAKIDQITMGTPWFCSGHFLGLHIEAMLFRGYVLFCRTSEIP